MKTYNETISLLAQRLIDDWADGGNQFIYSANETVKTVAFIFEKQIVSTQADVMKEFDALREECYRRNGSSGVK